MFLWYFTLTFTKKQLLHLISWAICLFVCLFVYLTGAQCSSMSNLLDRIELSVVLSNWKTKILANQCTARKLEIFSVYGIHTTKISWMSCKQKNVSFNFKTSQKTTTEADWFVSCIHFNIPSKSVRSPSYFTR